MLELEGEGAFHPDHEGGRIGPCLRIGMGGDAWAELLAPALGIVAVYPDEKIARRATHHSAELAAWEPDFNVRRVFDVATPAAVLLGADGLMAGGPVVGEDDVEALVDLLGPDHVLFGSDYPHPEGLAEPNAFADLMPNLPERDLRLVMRSNAAGLLGLPA